MKKVVTLGEILLRLSTKEGQRFSQATALNIHLGGAESNVAINLANLGYKTKVASIVPDNPLGNMAIEHLNRYNVDTNFVDLEGNRIGTYYLESGKALKSPSVFYDREYSSFANGQHEWDLKSLFEDVSLLHVSGITIALSAYWLNTTIQIIQFAKDNGVKISFDMNYRAKLWDINKAKEGYQRILPFVDYCSASQLDAIAFFDVEKDVEDYHSKMKKKHPNIELFYSTNRTVISASHHKLQGCIWKNRKLYTSRTFDIYPIVDRIGAGDAYAAGILHGILSNHSLTYVVDFATVSAVLKHSIHGDVNLFQKEEIENHMDGGGAMKR